MASNLPPSATSGFGRQELPLEPFKFPEESGDHTIKPAEEEKIHGANDTPDESYEYDWDCDSGVSDVSRFDMYKVYVGPLPYYVDSETLGKLFQAAGTVEVAKVVRNFRTYERTGQSIGLGYVKYTNARDATKAMKMFNEYDWDGRIIRAFKDAPNVIYVGNLSSTVDDDRLHKFFGEHGEVLNARVMYNEGTRQSLGYGFVVMAPGVSEMNAAIVELDGQAWKRLPHRSRHRPLRETKAVAETPVQDKENVEETEKKEQPLVDADEAAEEDDKKESNATEEAAPEARQEPESAVQEEKEEAAKE